MMNTVIQKISARQVLDCKARPMLEVDVFTQDGSMGRGAAPTGTSVGAHEAFVLRDYDVNEFNGLSVHKAVNTVETVIAPALLGMDAADQRAIDQRMLELDGTENKERLGGNSIYSVSIACLRAAAAAHKMPVYRYLRGGALTNIPLPTFNVINGGRYPQLTQPFNEFMLAPWKADSVEEAVELAVKVYQRLEQVISRYLGGKKPFLGGSYGWAAPSDDPDVVLQLMAQAVEECGCADKMAYCLDCASSEMYDRHTDTYLYGSRRVSREELIDHAAELIRKYPILFIEDLLAEDDWDGFVQAHQKLKGVKLIGDDFIVTNRRRLQKAYECHALDGFILKPNQVGTITEALDTYAYAQSSGLLTIPSGRSGGAVGDIVADLALALEAPISKNGAPKSGERLDKINSLLRASSDNPHSHLCDLTKLFHPAYFQHA